MVRQGKLNLLTQGTIICPFNSETDIDISDDAKVRIKFSIDKTNAETRTDFLIADGILNIIFVNFDNQQGAATTEPINIGQIGTKEVMMGAAVYAIGKVGSAIRVVHYNFFEKMGE